MIKFPKYEGGDDKPWVEPAPPAEVTLPPSPIIDAGVAKFLELANLNWPKQKGDFSLVRFDLRNIAMLRMTIGLVYREMLQAQLEQENESGGPGSAA